MASITDMARQAVTAPIRLVTHVAEGDGHTDIDSLREAIRSELRSALSEADRAQADQLAPIQGTLTALMNQLTDLQTKIDDLSAKLDDVHEDAQHIRTEQAAGRAKKKATS